MFGQLKHMGEIYVSHPTYQPTRKSLSSVHELRDFLWAEAAK